MKNSLIMASLLASLAASPVMAQTEDVPLKKTDSTPNNTVARSPDQRMKTSTKVLARNNAVNARRRL